MTISTPALRSRTCGPLGAPPYTHLSKPKALHTCSHSVHNTIHFCESGQMVSFWELMWRGARILDARGCAKFRAFLLDLHC